MKYFSNLTKYILNSHLPIKLKAKFFVLIQVVDDKTRKKIKVMIQRFNEKFEKIEIGEMCLCEDLLKTFKKEKDIIYRELRKKAEEFADKNSKNAKKRFIINRKWTINTLLGKQITVGLG
jgi:hypothetical protein